MLWMYAGVYGPARQELKVGPFVPAQVLFSAFPGAVFAPFHSFSAPCSLCFICRVSI